MYLYLSLFEHVALSFHKTCLGVLPVKKIKICMTQDSWISRLEGEKVEVLGKLFTAA